MEGTNSIRGKVKTVLGDGCDEEEFHFAWSDYIKEKVWWLKDSKKERDSNIIKAVVGLIKYDATHNKTSEHQR